jgi:methanethiol S-methyltransferase
VTLLWNAQGASGQSEQKKGSCGRFTIEGLKVSLRKEGTAMKENGGIKGVSFLLYGVFCYAAFLATFLYAIGFVGNFWGLLGLGPMFRSIDSVGSPTPLGRALVVDALLLGLFAVQHSVMARAGWKRWWTRFIPPAIERSTFVLAASLCLALLFWQWRPIGTTPIWNLTGGPLVPVVVALSLAGWLMVLLATFMLDHAELFGLRQVWSAFRNRPHPGLAFAAPGLYRTVRHPIYLGFIIAFWATPTMTLGHLVFAVATTAYILVAIQLEERDLVGRYGEQYREYRRRVGMLFPWPRRTRPSAAHIDQQPAGNR